MYKTISNEIIKKLKIGYVISKYITDENEELSVKQWVEKYRKVIPAQDIIWLLLRKEFLSEKDLRLFSVWCAREALKLVENPDKRSVNACNVAERYANGQATKEELLAARKAAARATNTDYSFVYHVYYAAYYAAYAVANPAYMAASTASDAAYAFSEVRDVASEAVRDAAANAARSAQIDQLLTYFE